LAVGLLTVIAMAVVAWLVGASIAPLLVSAIAGCALLLAVLGGWAVHCRQQVPFFALLAAPFYVVVKLPIYLAFLRKRQSQWIRTQRDLVRMP
jgi:hypothetical protein